MDYFDAVKARRSYYAINKECPIPEARLRELVTKAVKHTPSSFNSHSSRAILLLGEGHQRLWAVVLDTLRSQVPVDQFPSTEKKIGSFAAGYGTVLYYEDQSVIQDLQVRYPLYRDNFPIWAEQSNAMLQYVVWTGLEVEGLGASLQHYNPLIDHAVAATFAVPEQWKLIAQMPGQQHLKISRNMLR